MKTVPTCIVCNRPDQEQRLGVHLTPLKARIFDIVKSAGEMGISSISLNGSLDRDYSRQTIKAHMWQINELIEDSGWCIRSERVRPGAVWKLKRRKK